VAAFDKGYRVNDYGDVVSHTGYIMKPQGGPKARYYTFCFCLPMKDGKRHKQSIAYHQLAAYQKFGEAALGDKVDVRHIDGNASNNRLSNIAIGTHRENMMDVPLSVRRAAISAMNKLNRLLTDDQVVSLRADKWRGMPCGDVEAKYGVSRSTVYAISSGRNCSKVGDYAKEKLEVLASLTTGPE